MKKFPFFATFSIILGILLSLSLGYLLSTFIVSTNLFQTSKVETVEKTYYLMSIAQFDNEQDIQKEQYQSQNCAGYIYENNGKFHVIASIYKNENDAELVKNSLKNNGYSPEILKISIDKLTVSGNFSTEEENILKNCLNIKETIFDNLYDIAISLDTNIYNETQAKLKINETYSTLITAQNNFETIIKNNSAETTKMKECFTNIDTFLQNLTNENYSSATQTLSSLIKETYCKILLEI